MLPPDLMVELKIIYKVMQFFVMKKNMDKEYPMKYEKNILQKFP